MAVLAEFLLEDWISERDRKPSNLVFMFILEHIRKQLTVLDSFGASAFCWSTSFDVDRFVV